MSQTYDVVASRNGQIISVIEACPKELVPFAAAELRDRRPSHDLIDVLPRQVGHDHVA